MDCVKLPDLKNHGRHIRGEATSIRDIIRAVPDTSVLKR